VAHADRDVQRLARSGDGLDAVETVADTPFDDGEGLGEGAVRVLAQDGRTGLEPELGLHPAAAAFLGSEREVAELARGGVVHPYVRLHVASLR